MLVQNYSRYTLSYRGARRLGDIAATLASCSTVQDPFESSRATINEYGGGRFGAGAPNYVPRKYACGHQSDHFAALNAFLSWLSVNLRGGDEMSYCERNQLAMPTLRMIFDGKACLLLCLLSD